MPRVRTTAPARISAETPPFVIPEFNPWFSIAALEEWLNGGSKTKTFSQHALRHYVRNAASNGLEDADAIRYIGTKILVHGPRFSGWLENGAASKAARRSAA